MAAIKFSKQNIQPNPLEVDYWVDITSNPYGGNIKYYNGYDWVDLLNAKGKPVNLDAYYNKLQMNQMLAGKASVESVNSKVDDTEVADVIKNIEFKDRGDGGIEMIILKYNDTTVGVTMPIASNTTSGVITKESFKDFVKLNQLQQLYSVFYTTIASIRSQYQPRLSAGKNIMIDRTTNTIHAIGKISTDWDDLTNVPDFDGMFGDVNDAIQAETDRAKTEESKLSARITDHVDVVRAELDLKADKKDMYTKDQVDEKVASVYKVKGSSAFEDLPTKGNIVGDVYNITNNFILNDIEYPFGTNLVWTENGWDTLSGVFDTTELEGFIDAVDNKVDEEIVRAKTAELNIQTQLDAEITRSTEADTTITQSISNTISTIKTYTDTKVSAETTRATNAEEALSTSLSTEISNREASDATLQSNIDIVDGKLVNYLPLSGGTVDDFVLLGVSETSLTIHNRNANVINISSDVTFPTMVFKYKDTPICRLTALSGNFYKLNSAFTQSYKIWDEGNDGEGSGLDADTLDGLHSNNFMLIYRNQHTFFNDVKTAGSHFMIVNPDDPNVPSVNSGSGNLLVIRGLNADTVTQLFTEYVDNGKTYIRSGAVEESQGGYFGSRPWKTIAFTDSDITGNANGAYELKSNDKSVVDAYGVRTYYGFIPQGMSAIGDWNSPTDGYEHNGVMGEYGQIVRTLRNTPASSSTPYYTDIFFNSNDTDIWYRSVINGKSKDWLKIATTESNVASATKLATPVKLWGNDFDGSTYIDGDIGSTKSDFTIHASNTELINLSTTGAYVNLAYGAAAKQYNTYVYGKDIRFKTNAATSVKMIIANNGNVGIGTIDPQYKLDVKGDVAFSGSLRTVSIYCTGIESGDYVDWYGVSWSEDSSDPTCTRIGNMALHRSLPILSAMIWVSITNVQNSNPEQIRPLTDDGKLKYGINNNDIHPIGTDDFAQNIMVKIPEFWYVDDYEPLTKTHNLKISQTAKAGWCHHKESYVGAYEGYNSGKYYGSNRGAIPTVSASRETLRSLARANGYEDEYKWNIYTYEEHRAICHLFLVEYATRNSQLAVNTTLTADGFKQGGLGSGCTTGSVKINGVDTYSFIPTGTTDSLGNGSGQVAYTVTQTDADGNEIGTVTRYANRYRGIENPFGHIWKHVDDIVNVYNAETTYKTVYKCNKPEYFATNKNAKYKPLCSFPGGSKMQGWSKEIKATINCDFFKYSIGGSESTYWCDYNYDNDDTTEHCLLISGGSSDGGWAGLFSFILYNGVSHYGANFGSRLTYLPWAE